MTNHRLETDSLGSVQVPAEALYGPQTARAVANFDISGQGIGRSMIAALGLIKSTAAMVNCDLNLLDARRAEAISQAAEEVVAGEHDAHFPVDIFQTGSGTSSNMNANEVIANRAQAILQQRGVSALSVHANDHVNLGQSSNDVFPSAIHIAAAQAIYTTLLPRLATLAAGFEAKAKAFDHVIKTGRTHLQDATPIRLGQEFSGYAAQIHHGIIHIKRTLWHLEELALGGTAVGTGLNTHPEFGGRVAAALRDRLGFTFREAANHFEAQSAQDACVNTSGALKALAVALIKIANDIRWLASGPRLGLGELTLPSVQPGSSIMPGKVNPVIAEALIMACTQVIANDTAISLGGLQGNFQLNTMLPLIARNLLEQISLLARSVEAFNTRLLDGLVANTRKIASLLELSPALVTALVPELGYDKAAKLAFEALEHNKTVRELVCEKNLIPQDRLDALFDLRKQTEPGFVGPSNKAE